MDNDFLFLSNGQYDHLFDFVKDNRDRAFVFLCGAQFSSLISYYTLGQK